MDDELQPSDMKVKDLPGRRYVRRVDVPNPPTVPNLKSLQDNRQDNIHDLRDNRQDNIHDLQDNEQCEIRDIEEGVIVPYRLPPGAEATGPDAIISELRAIERLLQSHSSFLSEIKRYLSYEVPQESTNLLETQQATSVATPGVRGSITQDQVTNGITPGYDEIEVWNLLSGRKAQRVWLVNDGVQGTGAGDNLFLRVSPDGKSFSPEFIMVLGEIRIANDIYAIRFRSPTKNITLRASEREIYPPYVTTVTNTFTTTGSENLPDFTARNVGVGVADAVLPNITVPDGFALVIRSNIANVANIFVSRTDATVAANRVILAPGDAIALSITNANLVHVAAAAGAQSVDILAEQI
jgi:hypothetical protein